MEQWVKDGRQLMYKRWQEMSNSAVQPNKKQPEHVQGVDKAVLEYVLQIFSANKLLPCVSSQLLQSEYSRINNASSSSSSSTTSCASSASSSAPRLEFKFGDDTFAPAIDRSGYFGLVQRVNNNSKSSASSSSSSAAATTLPIRPHSRVLVDYAWVFRGRVYDLTQGFSFIAGAGTVTQVMEESVLYCSLAGSSSSSSSSNYIYEVAEEKQQEEFENEEKETSSSSSSSSSSSCSSLIKDGTSLDDFEEFLCDSEFAFRDEGTRLPATGFCVSSEKQEEEEKEHRVLKSTSEPALFIPPDATVSLLIRVTRFCNPVSISKHIEFAESLKEKGNESMKKMNNEKQQQQQQSLKSAKRWYERAMLELSPEALRVGDFGGGESASSSKQELIQQDQEETIKKLLTSLSHNLSLCFFEEAASLSSSSSSSSSSSFESASTIEQRDILKKSIRFATEAIKMSQETHLKSFFRRATANARLGNFEEAEKDLDSISKSKNKKEEQEDASVITLREFIKKEKQKADQVFKNTGLFS